MVISAGVVTDAQEAASTIMPSLVKITMSKSKDQGTGIVLLDKSGRALVVTAAHVISNESKADLRFQGAPAARIAVDLDDALVGSDNPKPDDDIGLAAFWINLPEGVRPAVLLNRQPRIGEPVGHAGYPGGEFRWGQTSVSGQRGQIWLLDEKLDAGSSGGPVVELKSGSVVGLAIAQGKDYTVVVDAPSVKKFLEGFGIDTVPRGTNAVPNFTRRSTTRVNLVGKWDGADACPGAFEFQKDDGHDVFGNCNNTDVMHTLTGQYDQNGNVQFQMTRTDRRNCQDVANGTIKIIDDGTIQYSQDDWTTKCVTPNQAHQGNNLTLKRRVAQPQSLGRAAPGVGTALGAAIGGRAAASASAPAQCKTGFVWREAFLRDTVCVTPERRAQVQSENAAAATHRSPTGGAYGPNSCVTGFVWRQASPEDFVCVLPQSRDLVGRENATASANVAR
jgi:hypothetical protein